MLVRLVLLLAASSIAVLAQQNTVPLGTGVNHGEVVFSGGATLSEAQVVVQGGSFELVANHPYTADQNSEYSTVTEPAEWKSSQRASLYRDSMGRTRADVWLAEQADGRRLQPSFVEIIDPAAGFRYVLDPNRATASRSPWPPTSQPSTKHPQAAQHHRHEVHGTPAPLILNESLGSKNLEGIMTEGTRSSITYNNESTGSEKAVIVVTENWTSPEMKLTLSSARFDQRYGQSRVTVTNLLQTEPDPTLFEVPPGYQIVDKPKAEPAIND